MSDVIVVGAGPAGAMTAKTAAEKGLEVLLLERELEIGVPDKCGEFLPSLEEMRRLTPDVRDLESLFDPPEEFVCNRTKYVRFIFPNEVEISVDFKGVVVERKLLDKHLANEAARAGADVATSTKALDILGNGEGVRARSLDSLREIPSRTVVAADGAYSLIARRAGLPVSRDSLDYGVGFQYEMVNVEHDSDYVDMYLGEDIAPGTYAWIIPKGDDVANVGTGMRIPYKKPGMNVRDYQHNFVENNPRSSAKLRRAKPTAIKAGCIPVGGPLENTSTDRVIAVGDAGGHTISTVGGGIPPGLICGRLAGQALASHILEGGPLREFDKAWRERMGRTLENALRIRKMGDILFRKKKRIDWVSKRGWLNEEMIEKFILCEMDTKMKLVEKTLGLISQR
ncbi:MAG: NAD(P)/FAD-dependent oxidoreductase [Candidatus Bathyarchaeota archaeon]|nr:MAG: NAD(P)/FAD-dependent oxidoreductase [Candidatus Bathyarchaeota archaeon]